MTDVGALGGAGSGCCTEAEGEGAAFSLGSLLDVADARAAFRPRAATRLGGIVRQAHHEKKE